MYQMHYLEMALLVSEDFEAFSQLRFSTPQILDSKHQQFAACFCQPLSSLYTFVFLEQRRLDTCEENIQCLKCNEIEKG